MKKAAPYVLLTIVSVLVAITPQAIFESCPTANASSDWCNLGSAIRWTLYVTLPFGLLAVGLLVLAGISFYNSRRR